VGKISRRLIFSLAHNDVAIIFSTVLQQTGMSRARGKFPLSPYCPEPFDGIVKNKLPGKLFFFFRSVRSSFVTYVCALYTGVS